MKTKQLFFVGLISILAFAPLFAQPEGFEMHSEDEAIMDAVASHDELSRFHEILIEYNGDAVNEDRSLAIFAPHDYVLEDVADGERISVERDDESILLNGSVAVLEAIEVSNGYLYVISETL